jgi:hypothetical protein
MKVSMYAQMFRALGPRFDQRDKIAYIFQLANL